MMIAVSGADHLGLDGGRDGIFQFAVYDNGAKGTRLLTVGGQETRSNRDMLWTSVSRQS